MAGKFTLDMGFIRFFFQHQFIDKAANTGITLGSPGLASVSSPRALMLSVDILVQRIWVFQLVFWK